MLIDSRGCSLATGLSISAAFRNHGNVHFVGLNASATIASLGKSSRFYDVTTSKEYEVESGPLTSDECLQVEQMLTSPTVRIPYGIYSALYDNDFDVLSPILITDFTSELASGECRKIRDYCIFRVNDCIPYITEMSLHSEDGEN